MIVEQYLNLQENGQQHGLRNKKCLQSACG